MRSAKIFGIVINTQKIVLAATILPYFAQTTLTNLSHITTLKRQQAVTKFKKGIKKSSNQAKRIEQKTNRDLEIPKLKHPAFVSIYIL